MSKPKLSLITTHYDMPFEIVEPLLYTIAAQQRIDFSDYEFVFVEDKPGHENWNERIRKLLPDTLNVIYVPALKYNTGVADSRQRGIDASSGIYFTIMDSDDYLYSTLVWRLFEQEIFVKNPPIGYTSWYHESIQGNTAMYHIQEAPCVVWCFGNYFQRKFVDKEKLRFFKGQRAGDDSGFNQLALSFTDEKKVVIVPMPTVVWADNRDSIAHNRLNEFEITCTPDHMRSWSYVAWSKYLRGNKQAAAVEMLNKIMMCYFAMYSPGMRKPEIGNNITAQDWEQKTKEMCAHIYRAFKTELNQLTEEEEAAIFKQAAMQMTYIPHITWQDWKKEIMSIPAVPKFDISWSHVWTSNGAAQGTSRTCFIDFSGDFDNNTGRYIGNPKKGGNENERRKK